MNRILRVVAMPLLAVVLLGVAAAGVRAQSSPSPFAGKFAGPFTAYTAAGTVHSGYITINVAADGTSASLITNYTLDVTVVSKAAITPDGASIGTFMIDGEVHVLKGTFRIDNGRLRGTVSHFAPYGLVATSTVDLPRK